jgi:hypothetical protein
MTRVSAKNPGSVELCNQPPQTTSLVSEIVLYNKKQRVEQNFLYSMKQRVEQNVLYSKRRRM